MSSSLLQYITLLHLGTFFFPQFSCLLLLFATSSRCIIQIEISKFHLLHSVVNSTFLPFKFFFVRVSVPFFLFLLLKTQHCMSLLFPPSSSADNSNNFFFRSRNNFSSLHCFLSLGPFFVLPPRLLFISLRIPLFSTQEQFHTHKCV